MIKELTIKNYRGFKDFKIESFDRVNLIAGANNVGKTSLLEALYLNLEPNLPEWPAPINLLRGFEVFHGKSNIETIWGWLFYAKNINQEIQIGIIDENNQHRTLSIQYLKDAQQLIFLLRHPKGENATFNATSSSFERTSSDKLAKFNGNGYQVGVVLGQRKRSIEEEAILFSKIDDGGRKNELLTPLKRLDSRLQDLAISVASGLPMINCDIGIGQRIPLIQMGEGMVHYFSIISEIINSSGGIVLIDEIDNGLHYSVMVDVWKAIAEAAHTSNTQIFATTHSFECIRAAHQAFSEREVYDLRLHRLERINDEIKAVTYNKSTLETSLELNWEVR